MKMGMGRSELGVLQPENVIFCPQKTPENVEFCILKMPENVEFCPRKTPENVEFYLHLNKIP